MVELASLSDPELVPQTAVSALGVREQAGRPILATLIHYLRPRHLLLVLDNCEHLLAACATLGDTLLRACPDLRLLAASREGLGIAGELTYHVPSLAVPDIRHLFPPERLAEHDAVRLFVERARYAQSAFTMTETNGGTVAQICHRLDGIPLAIELAAARMKSMSVERIAERLTDRFRLLTGGSRTALRRHQTLRNAVDWSYDLLSQGERSILDRLSVFAGGFTLEAAEVVCGGRSVDEGAVLDVLTRLVDKSLVTIDQAGFERYRMLETIREYTLDKLYESGESEDARRCHRDFFLALAEEGYDALMRPDAALWRKRLEAEHDNIRIALRWSIDHEDWEAAARLGGAISRFWYFRGFLNEGKLWLEELLKETQRTSPHVRANLLSRGSMVLFGHGEYGKALRMAEEALALFRELGDQQEIALALYRVGTDEMARGNHDHADKLLGESASLSRQRGDTFLIADALRQRGHVAARRGDYGLATSLLEESLSGLRQVGSRRYIGWALRHLGLVKHYQGQSKQAIKLLEEALVGFRELEDYEGIAHASSALGLALRGIGDLEGAAKVYRESLIVSSEIDFRWAIIEDLVGFAALSVSEESGERAVRLLAAADALQKTTEYIWPVAEQAEFDQMVDLLRGKLGEGDFAAAWEQGKNMSPDRAVEYALKEI